MKKNIFCLTFNFIHVHLKNVDFMFFIIYTIIIFTSCAEKSDETTIFQFDSNKKVSGKKFAIKDISPGLPSNWDEYNYVVLEMKSSTSQRFQVGFTTEAGYNELRIMSYAANGWIKLAIPLRFYTQLPGSASDMAGTMNQPRYTGWINLGGKRGPLHGVDSIGIRMHVPLNNPTIELRSISLSIDDPGDEYLGNIPLVDEFGQWNLGDFEGKINSLDQLEKEWAAEEKDLAQTTEYTYSKYGGYLNSKVEGTGYFRTEKINDRWWFVDPDGYLFLSLGVNCVGAGRGGTVNYLDKREGFCKELPPSEIAYDSDRSNRASFGKWNLYRRFGEDYPSKSKDMIISRMEHWGINTIANWSEKEVIRLNRKAFMLQLSGVGIQDGIMGLPDVYTDGFEQNIDAVCKEYVAPYKDNPWLIGYFTGNEPPWLGKESRLCDLILAEPDDRPIKIALKEYLVQSDSPVKRTEFIYNTFSIFLHTVNNAIKKHDPNHLSLGIRFSHIHDDAILEICKEVFDVFSFNSYRVFPRNEMMDRILNQTDMPMIIGEYHFGTVDRGMAQALIQVENQKERGIAYRNYTERAFAHPGLIGVAYFQWADQDLTGRRYDGENYNCGLVDVTDRPYPYMVEHIKETSKSIYEVHSGNNDPFDHMPSNLCGLELIPDIWDE